MSVSNDNMFLQPSLPPPQPLSDAPVENVKQGQNPKDMKPVQRDASGNVIRETNRKERSDTGEGVQAEEQEGEIQQDTEVHEKQDQEGEEGRGGQDSGGQGSGGRGGSGGNQDDSESKAIQAALEQFVTSGKISDSRNPTATVSTEAKAQVFSKDQITVYETKDVGIYNLGDTFSTKDLSTLRPEFPSIPAPGTYDITVVQKQVLGDTWLNNTYIVAVTDNLTKLMRAQSEQQITAGRISVQLLVVIGDLGVALGDLALEKAQLEAEMYKFQAMAAFLSFGVTLAAGAISIAGIAASSIAKAKTAGTESGTAKNAPTAGGAPISTGVKTTAPPSTTPSTSAAPKTTAPGTPSAPPAAATGTGRGAGSIRSDASGSLSSPTGSVSSSKSNLRASTDGVQASGPDTTQFSTAKGGGVSSDRTFSSNQDSGISGAPAKTVRPLQEAAPTADNRGGWMNRLKARFGFGSKGDAGGLGATGTPARDASALNRTQKIAVGGKMASSLGQTLVQGSSSFANALDNFIKMIFTPQIGAKEREIQIMQSQKQIAQQALESAMADLKNAAQLIDTIVQALQKIQDENQRAYNMKG